MGAPDFFNPLVVICMFRVLIIRSSVQLVDILIIIGEGKTNSCQFLTQHQHFRSYHTHHAVCVSELVVHSCQLFILAQKLGQQVLKLQVRKMSSRISCNYPSLGLTHKDHQKYLIARAQVPSKPQHKTLKSISIYTTTSNLVSWEQDSQRACECLHKQLTRPKEAQKSSVLVSDYFQNKSTVVFLFQFCCVCEKSSKVQNDTYILM